MKRTQIAKSALATAAGIAIGATAALSVTTPEPAPEPAPVVVEQPTQGHIAGTIRWQSPTSWATVHDTGHEPEGIREVQVLRDRVRVHYTFTASKVAALQVTPDESLTAADVRCGASVGLSYSDIFCYLSGQTSPVNPALLTRKGGNIWLAGTFDL
ncbi:hypothetical protein [Cellulosimicrobium funkei]|uniref:hypothetical protein n=1 Tax=Cellulosimicrobium funkei TaxID=264251 RepID=UPI003417858F